jgi:rhodanese-related sulfurtransferase
MKKIFYILLLVSSLFANYIAPMQVSGSQYIDSQKAYEMFQKGVKFIDVRPDRFVKEGKIQNAYHLYVDLFSKQKLNSIAKVNEDIVIYCNGQGCPLSAEAIVKAASYGYTHVYYYRDGYPAWKFYKLPTE